MSFSNLFRPITLLRACFTSEVASSTDGRVAPKIGRMVALTAVVAVLALTPVRLATPSPDGSPAAFLQVSEACAQSHTCQWHVKPPDLPECPSAPLPYYCVAGCGDLDG